MKGRKHPSKKKTVRKTTSPRQFKLHLRKLTLGKTYPELAEVQSLLKRWGYLLEDYESERLDEPTQRGLIKFQSFYGLEKSGTVDKPTVDKLEVPRCDSPDLVGPRLELESFTAADLAASFTSRCLCPTNQPLTYTINRHKLPSATRSPTLHADLDLVKGEFVKAFAIWAAAVPLQFVPAQDDPTATFKISWEVGNHGDGVGNAFTGTSQTIAHAFPCSCVAAAVAGLCHFDNTETWALEDDVENQVFDLQTQALHEIGHLLGLVHTTDPNSVMFPNYVGERRKLSPDVTAAIQSMYGAL
jgi:peptidoglycan hydrolase-like protein with peptidoglycan-binding domain